MFIATSILGLGSSLTLLLLAMFSKLPTVIEMNRDLNVTTIIILAFAYLASAYLMTGCHAPVSAFLMVISAFLFIITKGSLILDLKSSLRNPEPELNHTVKQMVKSMK